MTVEAMRAQLQEDDIRRLIKAPTEEERALSAYKICRRIAADGLSGDERQAANQILQLMAQDAAELVRRALAVTLKSSPHLPREIALKLAKDIDTIAVPILAFSPSFTDEDLLRVLDATSEIKHIAIAQRDEVSAAVSAKIVQTCSERPVATLASNDGANIASDSFRLMLKRFSGSEKVADALIDRSALPIEVTEKMVSMISDEALRRLSQRHALPPQLAVELAEGARERATIDLIDQADCTQDMQRFVQQLNLNGRLTPSLIVRAAACGSISFVEWALAELAGVPHPKAWLLVHDAGALGLRALFERTGIPGRHLTVLRLAIDLYHETDMAAARDRKAFRQTMIQRVLTRHQGFAEEDLEYLMGRLDAPLHDEDAGQTEAEAAAAA